jgi:hypothetical protein
MLLLLVPAAMCGGVLGGLMGAGGPPLMAAYSVLDLHKDVLRGFGVVPSCFMLVRLALYTSNEGAVAQASEAALYALIMAGGLAGVSAGARLRPWVDGERVVLLTHFVVREDAQLLYGFLTEGERTAFRALIKISSVGPRTALSVLSGMSVADLAQAVTLRPQSLGPDDIAPLQALGFSDEDVLDVLHATAIFGWANRLMHNLGEPVHPAPAAGAQSSAAAAQRRRGLRGASPSSWR